ncbi:hypothetical protein PTTG_25516 [Puccinia triticina 1-1 BBBD Race 1]|uniref:Uncharacterized protein n=1 Tax=Puccinia triticina (isolate 1-1 / race 1 (BBBD)) TaxID=630390 RepID=A0A180H178_PUCT1|nr:hypothetical protein PTTG_25516 [Puccinia triticina 1-1 BBBD Race 1]
MPGAQTAAEKVLASASSKNQHVEPRCQTPLEKRITEKTKDIVKQDQNQTNKAAVATQREDMKSDNVERLLLQFSKEKKIGQ